MYKNSAFSIQQSLFLITRQTDTLSLLKTVLMKADRKYIGSIFLVAGSCIGAGMLALPISTYAAGLLPGIAMLSCIWLLMLYIGRLITEASLLAGEGHFISIAGKSLGKKGKWITTILFFFFLYSLNIAYLSGCGTVLHTMAKAINIPISQEIACCGCTVILGIITYMGVGVMSLLNFIFMIGLIVVYSVLVFYSKHSFALDLVEGVSWKQAFLSVPILVVCFGFHNLIPSIVKYVGPKRSYIHKIIFYGSLCAWLFYLLWHVIVFFNLRSQNVTAQALSQGGLKLLLQYVSHTRFNLIVELFVLCALMTSYLSLAVSLIDFLADGLHLKNIRNQRLLLVIISLIPPLLLCLYHVSLFTQVLSIAGGMIVSILFCFIPALMVWSLRLKKEILLFQGKIKLLLVMIGAIVLFTLELYKLIS